VALRKAGVVNAAGEKVRDEGNRSLGEHLEDWRRDMMN
jgi:hypothetical protein